MISNSKYLSENIRDMSQDFLDSVVVLNYNAAELLRNCIKSIKKSTYKNLEIIVVDNISNDNKRASKINFRIYHQYSEGSRS